MDHVKILRTLAKEYKKGGHELYDSATRGGNTKPTCYTQDKNERVVKEDPLIITESSK